MVARQLEATAVRAKLSPEVAGKLASTHERLQLLRKEEASLRAHLQRCVLREKQEQVFRNGVARLEAMPNIQKYETAKSNIWKSRTAKSNI